MSKKITKIALGLLVASVLVLISAGGASATDGATTLTGEYQWDQAGIDGELKAIFTPSGENQWDVAFHFEFRGESHVYTGAAEGSLDDGSLEGEVKNESKERTFTFTGSFAEGAFSGTHAEITGGRTVDTGTLTLGR